MHTQIHAHSVAARTLARTIPTHTNTHAHASQEGASCGGHPQRKTRLVPLPPAVLQLFESVSPPTSGNGSVNDLCLSIPYFSPPKKKKNPQNFKQTH